MSKVTPEECTLEQRWAVVFNTLRKLESSMAHVLKGYTPVIALARGEPRNVSSAEISAAYPNEEAALTFRTLRAANIARLPQFKNKHGGLAHSQPDGSDWSPAQWLQAVVGELGEFANIRKKFERGDLTFEEYEIAAKKELADVQCYLDILARRCLDHKVPHPAGVDLGAATRDKFNEVSRRIGCNVEILGNLVVDAASCLGA
mgnify:CR=1 FL=1